MTHRRTGRSDEVVDGAGARDGAHRMRAGAPGGGEGVLDGVAGGGCGDLVVFDPRGATAPEGPQDEERGDGQCDAARDRERSRHAVKRSVEHLTQSEAETQPGEAAPGRRERHEEEGAGLAQACPSWNDSPGDSCVWRPGDRRASVPSPRGEGGLCHRAGERDLSGRDVR